MGPGTTSSDILGIEISHNTVRGVRLDQETSELIAAAECPLGDGAISVDGIIEPGLVGRPLDELIDQLGVTDRAALRVGFTLGPRNAGVGSGPAMAGWLAEQAVNLQEPMMAAGELGIVFLPSRAVDAASKLALGSGIDLVRVDLAPVAAVRAIGDQVDDLICIGSGCGWQARMRDFEVLEAMENPSINRAQPLIIVGADGMTSTIRRYGWVEISEQLDRSHRLNIGQLASAVGAAIGVAYESPANLLRGDVVNCGPVEAEPAADPSLAHLAGYELDGDGAEATIRLNARSESARADEATRTPREAPGTPARSSSGSAGPGPSGGRARRREPAAAGVAAGDGARSRSRGGRPTDAWGETIEESDPINLFSPDTDEDEMLKRRGVNLDLLFGLLFLSAIGLLLAYIFL